MITKYGLNNFFPMIFISILLILSIFFNNISLLFLVPFFLGITLFVFSFIFFRDPNRKVDESILSDKKNIISPADGKVLEIVEEIEPFYLKQKVKRISIFLSPIDVHVNWIPMSGVISYLDYFKGKFLAAYKPKSSLLNEQTHIGIKNEYGMILFKQIVGVAARRLVCDLELNQEVKLGSKFGMMKFGSRIDIFIPLNSELFVSVNERVIAAKTLLAKL